MKTFYSGHPDQRYGHISYAQHGDDLMLLNIFHSLGVEKPSYLDIGAHHPTTISNTQLLYERGSRGVNVEANPNLIAAFHEQRPEDVNVCVGVGYSHAKLTFHMYSPTDGRNTFDLNEVEATKKKVYETREIDVVPLDEIVKTYCKDGRYPDLLSCDIEGMDCDVLYHADFSISCPRVICVETRVDSTKPMEYMLNEKGYSLYCRTGENLIFIRQHLLKLLF